MQIRKSPNWWSCLATAVAIVLDIPVRQLFNEIGHDGSEIIFPELPEPQSRRTIHPQEFLPSLLRRGYGLMIVEAVPVIAGPTLYPITFPEGNAARVSRYMQLYEGVITGQNSNGQDHAVAWDKQLYYDPNANDPQEELDFNIREFLAFVKAKL